MSGFFLYTYRRKVKSPVLESSYYSFTLDCCNKSIGIISPGNPCWVSSWKTGAIESRFGWITWVIDKEITKTTNQPDWVLICSFKQRSAGELAAFPGASSFFFYLFLFGGLGFFFPPTALLKFVSISGSSFKVHCYKHSGGGQHSLLKQRQWFHFGACLIPKKLGGFFHPFKSKTLEFSLFLFLFWSLIASFLRQSPEYFWKEFFD